MPPPLHALLPLLLLLSASTTAAVDATTNGTRTQGARHLLLTNRLQNLRTDVQIFLREASNEQYKQHIASQNDRSSSPTSPRWKLHPYEVNKNIARYIRVSLERWYGPQAQYLRSVNDMFGEVGDEGPLGSDKDLGLYWNVAVSNVIQPIDRNWLPVQTQLGEVTAIVEVPLVPGSGNGMPSDRPCDKDIVPDSCANTGGLVSVQLRDITITAGDLSDVWHKNAVVFISRKNEFTFDQAYIKSFLTIS